MVELCYLDDVGQAYDIVLRKPEMIGTTLGRHVNDQMTSFYSWSPSKFLVEYGWGGRTIDPDTWTPHERRKGLVCGATTDLGCRPMRSSNPANCA